MPTFPSTLATPAPSRRPVSLLGTLAAILMPWLGACSGGDGGGGGSPTPPPGPPAVATVQVTPPASPILVGQTVQLEARLQDASGATLTGRTVNWSSSAEGVARVSADGRVTGETPGVATVTASAGGQSGSVQVTVVPAAVATVTLDPPRMELALGGAGSFTAVLRDARGNPLSGRAVAWSSSGNGIATVNGGVVTPVSVGEAVITATSEGRSGTAPVRVVTTLDPVISGITPATLVEGETATLAGERFDPTPQGNVVRVGGVAAQVISASSTSLEIRVPEGACLPAGNQAVRVTVGSRSVERSHPFRPAAIPALPLGELRVVRLQPGSQGLCLQFAAGAAGDYLVGVQSVSETPDLRSPVRVSLATGAGGAPGPGVHAVSPGEGSDRSEGAGQGAGLPPDPQPWLRAHEEAHARHWAEQERLVRSLLARGAPMAAPGPGAPPAVPPSVQVGQTVPVKVSTGCADVPAVSMVVRALTARVAVVGDPDNPQGGYTPAELQQLAEFVDQQLLPRLEAAFGALTDIDANGRLVIVVSKRVNDIGGVLGFVSSKDFFPAAACPASNRGEYFYIITPDPNAPSNSSYNKANSLPDLPRLSTHELTHVFQLFIRLLQGRTNLPIWILEGQAVLGEELMGRTVLGLSAKANLGTGPAFGAAPGTGTFWFQNRFNDLYFYWGYVSPTTRAPWAPGPCGWLGRNSDFPGIIGPCISTRLPYGPAWSFLRWVTDHLAHRVGGEDALQAAIIGLTTGGLAAIGDLVGEDYRDLLAAWAAMQYTDDRFQGMEERLTFPSWNLKAMMDRVVQTGRLTPFEHPFTPFSQDVEIAAGSSAYLLLTGGSQGGTAVLVQSQAGGSPGGTVQLWAVKVR